MFPNNEQRAKMTHVIVFLRPTGQTGQTLPEQRRVLVIIKEHILKVDTVVCTVLYVHDY